MGYRLLMLWYRFRWLIVVGAFAITGAAGVLTSIVIHSSPDPQAASSVEERLLERAGETLVVRADDGGLQECRSLHTLPRDVLRELCIDRLPAAVPVLLSHADGKTRFLAGDTWVGADETVRQDGPAGLALERALAGVIVDLDNDTHDELILLEPVGQSQTALRIFTRTADGTLLDTTSGRGIPTLPRYSEQLAADLNEDGFTDLVLYGGTHSVRILLNGGRRNPGTLELGYLGVDQLAALVATVEVDAQNRSDFLRLRSVVAAAVRDVDGDGHQDLVVVTPGGVGGVIWGAGPAGFLAEPSTITLPVGAVDLAVDDVNHDGVVDLIVAYDPAGASAAAGADDGGFVTYLGSRRGDFIPTEALSIKDRPGVRAVALADLDNDGWVEVIVGVEPTGAIVGSGNNGGLWVYRPVVAIGPVLDGFVLDTARFDVHQEPVSRIAAADVDGNGSVDLVLAGRGLNSLRWWRNDTTVGSYVRVVVRGAARLDAVGSNVSAVGAVVEVTSVSGTYRGEIGALDGRGGTGSLFVHVGIADAQTVTVKVTFPVSGRSVERSTVTVGQTLIVVEPAQ